MMELTKQFRFEAAHTLERAIETDASRRIHGHSYQAEVAIRGVADPATGMVMDLGALDVLLADLRHDLDHRFLDDVAGLGPATLENLACWIWDRLQPSCPGLSRVTVGRPSSGESASRLDQSATTRR